MRRLIMSAAVVGTLVLLPRPVPADAETVAKKCLEEAIESCDRDFQGNTPEMVAIRGYCYMIRAAMCKIFDPD